MGFFVADFGNFENGWEDLWEFHDFGWEFLYFGSNHTVWLAWRERESKQNKNTELTETVNFAEIQHFPFSHRHGNSRAVEAHRGRWAGRHQRE